MSPSKMSLWDLLYPDGDLAPHFVNVLGLLALYAILVAHRTRATLKDRARKVAAGRFDAELDQIGDANVWVLSLKTARERRVENLPGVMLVVGLLGTFLGLALAIRRAADALGQQVNTTQQMRDQIQLLTLALQAMGMKFQTSIYGILGSLFVRALGSFWVEREWDRLVAAAFARLREVRRLASNDERAQRDDANKRLSLIADRVERLVLLDQLEVVPAKLGEQAEALARAATALGSSLKSFERVAERAQRFAEAAEAVASATTRLEASATRAFERVSAGVDRDVEAARALVDAASRLERAAVAAGEQIARGVGGVVAMTNALGTTAARIEKEAGATTGDASRAADRAAIAASAAANAAVELGRASAPVLEELRRSADRASGATEALAASSARLEAVATLTRAAVIELGNLPRPPSVSPAFYAPLPGLDRPPSGEEIPQELPSRALKEPR